jgi:dihydrofolate reductase
MGSIRVHEFMTLDGVIDAPTWSMDYPFDPKMGEAIAEIMGGCRSILLGRHTFEMFAPAWSERTAEDDPGAPFMNDSAKYVVAATPPSVEWTNSTVIGRYDAAAIRRLKDEVDGDIYVSGSGTLVRAMLTDGLVDELHLLVYPIVVGSGPRLFVDGATPKKMKLLACESYASGVVRLGYEPASS